MGSSDHGPGGTPGVGPEDADALAGDGAMLLDVREPEEWSAGHAPAAHHVPLGELGNAIGGLRRDRRVVVVCRSGHRSAAATGHLVRSGFDAVNLEGGMLAWAAAGLEMVADGPGPPTVL